MRLRRLGAPGVTVLRDAMGYATGGLLRPDLSWLGRRDAPTVSTIVDTPDHVADWLQAIDEVAGHDVLATHEFVSAHRVM